MNSTSVLSLSPPLPGPANHHCHSLAQTLTLDCATRNFSFTVSGAGLRFAGAHIKAPKVEAATTTKSIKLMMAYHRKKTFLLRSFNCTSSLSSSSPEERENSVGDDMVSAQKSSKLLTLPTVLTLARVVAVPIFIGTYYMNDWWGTTATTSIFVVAAITDWLDGYLARKMDLGSAFGAFLDPVADKLMVAATLVLLCSRPPGTTILGHLPWLFPVPAIAIVGREITMSAVREWAASQNAELLQAVAVNNLGKWKTATQMAALTILLSTRDSSLAGRGTLAISGVVLLYISAGLAVWSLAVYMRKISSVLLK